MTDYVGPRTLATMGRVTTERAATLVADLAWTVADLHTAGQVHGAVCPEHALVAGDRVVLCGFATDGAATPADDVNGIGRCLGALLEPDLDEEPIPDRRPWRRTPWIGYRHRALLTLADQATHDEPGRRPAARALADAVLQAGGGTVEPEPTRAMPNLAQALVDLVAVRLRRHPRLDDEPPRRHRRVAALAVVGVVVMGLGVMGTTRSTSEVPVTAAASPTFAPEPSTDLDGDGRPEVVRLGTGWIEVDGRRYRVGRPGDAIALGDWDGDGRATVALLQRRTGTVWRFATWDPDASVAAEPVGDYPGAIDLEERPAEGHDQLLVRRSDGTTAEVREA